MRSSIRIKIPVCGKNIRNILGFDGKGLEQLKGKFEVCKIQLDCVSKDVYMEGNSKQIEQAKNALLALLEEKNSQSFLNNSPYSTEDCMVCSEEIVTGYRLQVNFEKIISFKLSSLSNRDVDTNFAIVVLCLSLKTH